MTSVRAVPQVAAIIMKDPLHAIRVQADRLMMRVGRLPQESRVLR